MNHSSTKILLLATVVAAGSLITSCKSKENTEATKDTSAIVTPATAAPTPAPVVIAEDTTLNASVRDAVKDFPTVKATAKDGEVMVSGEVKRADLQTLMQHLNSIHAKKINRDSLTVK